MASSGKAVSAGLGAGEGAAAAESKKIENTLKSVLTFLFTAFKELKQVFRMVLVCINGKYFDSR